MIRGANLRKALDESGPEKYKGYFREALGFTEDGKLDKDKQGVDPKEISIQEVAMEFMGRDYYDELDKIHSLPLYEVGGSGLMPSTFTNISAFKDSVTGLLEAMIMDAYQSPEFIGDQMVTTIPTRVNGGKLIGVKNTGAEANQASLPLDTPYPNVGLDEDWVDIPENQRRGLTIEINKLTILYDRTFQVQEKAQATGYTIARNREIRIADLVMGITNTYVRNGVAANTYNSIAGNTPNDYVNQAAIGPVTNYTHIDEAVQVLESNTDPYSGFEITMQPEQATIICAPNRKLQMKNVVRASMVEAGARAATDVVTVSPNPLEANYPIVASRIWYNRGVAEGYSDNTWWMGQFPRAFAYRQLIPFFTASAPVGAEEMRRDVSLIFISQEHGVPFIKEPRFAGQFSPEGTG